MNTVLEDKGILDIEGYFWVPLYQRGYRWGKHEVTCLLEDIFSCNDNSKYYLQPVVVRRREKGDFELIDGQQRLTTLFLLLSYLQKMLDKKNFLKYSIVYDIRENFLNFIHRFDEEEAQIKKESENDIV